LVLQGSKVRQVFRELRVKLGYQQVSPEYKGPKEIQEFRGLPESKV
jgi:hypothetical protein